MSSYRARSRGKDRRTQAEIRKDLVELQRSMRDGVTLRAVEERFGVRRSRAMEMLREAAALAGQKVESTGRGGDRIYRCPDLDPFRLELAASEVLPALVLLRDAPFPLFGGAMAQAKRLSAQLPAALDAATAKRVQAIASRVRLRFQPTRSVPEASFTTIVNAMADDVTIRFAYAKADALPALAGESKRQSLMSTREAEPWAVFFAKRHLYLIARPVGGAPAPARVIDRSSTLRTFKLSRMRNVRPTATGFRLPGWFDLDAYLADSWEVVRFGSRPRSRVVIDLSPTAAEHLLDTTWHQSQEVQRDPDGRVRLTAEGMVRVTFRVRGFDEIKYWVLGLGSMARVVKPEGLRRAVLDELKRMRHIYR